MIRAAARLRRMFTIAAAFALVLQVVLARGVVAQTKVDADLRTTWTVDKATQLQEHPFEGTIDICRDGQRALYTVISNQLSMEMSVRQSIRADKLLVMTFRMHSADGGRAFSSFGSFPPAGTPLFRAMWTQEYAMKVEILDRDFVARLRRWVPQDAARIFPSVLYRSVRAMTTAC